MDCSQIKAENNQKAQFGPDSWDAYEKDDFQIAEMHMK